MGSEKRLESLKKRAAKAEDADARKAWLLLQGVMGFVRQGGAFGALKYPRNGEGEDAAMLVWR